MKIRFLSLAQQEVDDAFIWYNEQVEGLGREFLDELDRAVRLIRRYPNATTEVDPGIRRCVLARFPYALLYGIEGESIVVIAVTPLHRRPRYWVDRLE